VLLTSADILRFPEELEDDPPTETRRLEADVVLDHVPTVGKAVVSTGRFAVGSFRSRLFF
jgi:hypothetical protein